MAGRWIWYPGDFELYHSRKQNLSREERGVMWPAFWKLNHCRSNVVFRKTVLLSEPAEFTVYSDKQGYVQLAGRKLPFGSRLRAEAGECRIEVYCAAMEGLPAIFVEGDMICSDETWQVEDYELPPVPVGTSSRYMDRENSPEEWQYSYERCLPKEISEFSDGVLYDFGQEMVAGVHCQWDETVPLLLCYGESKTEARDVAQCYYSQQISHPSDPIPARAFRYLFLPGRKKEDQQIEVIRQYTEYPVRAEFHCNEAEFDQIWQMAERTFGLCCGPFIIDGIKRDKWIWSGDAYQSYFTNQYLYFDEELEQRTILALRGSSPVKRHINTILDYSMYWVISVWNHYMAYENLDFVRLVYPYLVEMMDFLEQKRSEHGFLYDPSAWTFVDWAEMDKDGPVCAEQMLFAQSYLTMWKLSNLIGQPNEIYQHQYQELKEKINAFYWCEEKGAYLDSFTSGRRHVTKHANIFALLFEIAEDAKREQIIHQVLENEQIDKITTPYFKFFELEALCQAGRNRLVKQEIKAYWGSMIQAGVTTFWEEYDPQKPLSEQYGMYNDPYGKSHCHAWGASPIYLLGRYFMGVRPLTPGYGEFEVRPQIELFDSVDAVIPVKEGSVRISWDREQLTVTSSRAGGRLVVLGKSMELIPDQPTTVRLSRTK